MLKRHLETCAAGKRAPEMWRARWPSTGFRAQRYCAPTFFRQPRRWYVTARHEKQRGPFPGPFCNVGTTKDLRAVYSFTLAKLPASHMKAPKIIVMPAVQSVRRSGLQ